MKHAPNLAALTLLAVASTAYAQTTASSTSHNPIVKDSTVRRTAAPAHGANSFTQDQAEGRITKAGYTAITGLTKTGGLWLAKAMKGTKAVRVALDYKGNVTVR